MNSLTRYWITSQAETIGEKCQKGRQQDEEQRDAVDPHVISELEAAEGDPARLLDELEIGGIRDRTGTTAQATAQN